MIEARALVVERAGRSVLDRVDLSVSPGELVAVLGPNGVGKSTLVAALAGELAPQAGTVSLDGVPLARLGIAELARRRAALSQELFVPFDFTVRELVAMGRMPHGGKLTRAEHELLDRALAELDLSGLAERSIRALSGGERRRVHLARTLAQLGFDARPRYALLDEPAAHLDAEHQHRVLEIFRGLGSSGLGVLAVLHEPNLALAFATRVVLLSEGRVLASGPPIDVLSPELVAEAFGVEAHLVDVPWSIDEKRLVVRGPLAR
jgi:iron complex transport system ATP-binding protein